MPSGSSSRGGRAIGRRYPEAGTTSTACALSPRSCHRGVTVSDTGTWPLEPGPDAVSIAPWESRRSSSRRAREAASRTPTRRGSSTTGATSRTSTSPASSTCAASISSTPRRSPATSSSCGRARSSTSRPRSSTTRSTSTSASRASAARARPSSAPPIASRTTCCSSPPPRRSSSSTSRSAVPSRSPTPIASRFGPSKAKISKNERGHPARRQRRDRPDPEPRQRRRRRAPRSGPHLRRARRLRVGGDLVRRVRWARPRAVRGRARREPTGDDPSCVPRRARRRAGRRRPGRPRAAAARGDTRLRARPARLGHRRRAVEAVTTRARPVTIVQAILVVNALPAFVNLMSIPDKTGHWFVWTVKPPANARVLGVMYGSACLLGLLGYAARSWPRQRVTFVGLAPFAVAATIVTLVTLKPFRAHPWYELAYWLLMYSVLFVLVPVTFVLNERASGGRLPVETPFAAGGRVAVAALSALLLVAAVGLLFELSYATRLWPFAITPLVPLLHRDDLRHG